MPWKGYLPYESLENERSSAAESERFKAEERRRIEELREHARMKKMKENIEKSKLYI